MIHGKYRLRNLSKVIWPWLVRELFLRFALPRPSGREAFALARVGASADPSIRLAYQLRAQSDAGVVKQLGGPLQHLMFRSPIAICDGEIGEARSIADADFVINTVQMDFYRAFSDI